MFFKIDGRYLTINDADAYVIYNRTNACDISVTNNRTSANRTYAFQDDRGRYLATDITWRGIYQ